MQHADGEGPGVLGEFLVARGIEHRIARADRGDALSLDGVNALVILGGAMGVYEADRYPFLSDEIALAKEAIARGLPTLGICLGSQILAAALGARVAPMGHREIGFHDLTLHAAAAQDPLFEGVSGLRPLHWHGDAFTLPEGAVALATSARTEHQAFRFRRAWGLLFHIEARREELAVMIASDLETLAEEGIDPRALAASDDDLARSRAVAEQVFSRFLG